MAEQDSPSRLRKRKRCSSLPSVTGRKTLGQQGFAFAPAYNQSTFEPLNIADTLLVKTTEAQLYQQSNAADAQHRTPVFNTRPAIEAVCNHGGPYESRAYKFLHYSLRGHMTGASIGIKQEPDRTLLQDGVIAEDLQCLSSQCSESNRRLQEIRSRLEQINKLREENKKSQALCARLNQRRRQHELTYADMMRKRRDMDNGIERILRSMESDDTRQHQEEQAVRVNEETVELVMIEIQTLSSHN